MLQTKDAIFDEEHFNIYIQAFVFTTHLTERGLHWYERDEERGKEE